MRCYCGSNKFVPLGMQSLEKIDKKGKIGKYVYLVNCIECGTTLACSKYFFNALKYLEESKRTNNDLHKVVTLTR